MRQAIPIAAAILLAMPSFAGACGACIEDKVAATYDHAVLERAQRDHRVVVFAEIRGDRQPAELEHGAAAAAKRVRGIDPASVRASESPLALSFSLDARISPETALAAIAGLAATPGMELAVVRVLR